MYREEDPNIVGSGFEITQTVSSNSVRGLSISQRKCVFRDEVELETSNIYSREACKADHMYKQAIAKCGCYLPGIYNSGTVFRAFYLC